MEVIRIPGYTEDEKLNIAERYLIPKQIKLNGLKQDEVTLRRRVTDIIRYYTREAGVRALEREDRQGLSQDGKGDQLEEREGGSTVTAEMLRDLLGVRKHNYGIAEEENKIGQVTGLAWTSVGGELLTIEAVRSPVRGATSKPARWAMSCRSRFRLLPPLCAVVPRCWVFQPTITRSTMFISTSPKVLRPKDGPSAGVAMCTALVSVLTGIPVRADVAMTGEITLRGEVLPIGGLKEKLLAARRGGIKTVIIPKENERDLKESAGQYQRAPQYSSREVD